MNVDHPATSEAAQGKVAERILVEMIIEVIASLAPAAPRPTPCGHKRSDDVANQNAGEKNARQIEDS
jgi:hypothetical protein